MDTSQRYLTADRLLKRAREHMKEAEEVISKDSLRQMGMSQAHAIQRHSVYMADTYARIAQGYLHSIEVRQM